MKTDALRPAHKVRMPHLPARRRMSTLFDHSRRVRQPSLERVDRLPGGHGQDAQLGGLSLTAYLSIAGEARSVARVFSLSIRQKRTRDLLRNRR
jgi:hypothetical protein